MKQGSAGPDTNPNAKGQRVWTVEVSVLPKAGVNDPQGESILGALGQLGYGQVDNFRSGKFFRLRIESSSESTAKESAISMCEQLLANPVIETYRIVVLNEDEVFAP